METCKYRSRIEAIMDTSLDIGNRDWLLKNSKLSQKELELVALDARFPTLSSCAFSMINEEWEKARILKMLFSKFESYEVIGIMHSVIKEIKSKDVLWDIYMWASTPKEAKPYIEDAINSTGSILPPVSTIIRIEKQKSD